MTGMIALAGQLFDQMPDPGQCPQVGVIAALYRTGEECRANPLQLRRREAGLPAGCAPALKTLVTLGLPCFEPAVSGLPANSQPPSHFGRIDTLLEELGGLKAPLFHCRVIALFTHAATNLYPTLTPVSLLYESQ